MSHTNLTNREIERLTADLKADPSLVVQLSNVLPYEDAAYLTYSLPNKLRKSLMDRYRLGLSRRPGYVVKVLYPHRPVVVRFVEAKSEEEAKALVVKKGSLRHEIKKTGVWPK